MNEIDDREALNRMAADWARDYDRAEAAEQQRDRLLAFIREHRSEAEERGVTANDRWLYGMAEEITKEVANG